MTALTHTRSWSFTVAGRPQPKGSKKNFQWSAREGGGVNSRLVESNEATLKPWMAGVSAKAATVFDEVIRNAVCVELEFTFARPKSHYGTGRNAATIRPSSPREMTTKPDIDKLARAALDALTGVAIADDSQVVALTLRKRYGSSERMVVWISEVTA